MKSLNQFFCFTVVTFLASVPATDAAAQHAAAQYVDAQGVMAQGANVQGFGTEVIFAPVVTGHSNGYYPYVIARPQDRQVIRDMPIQQRPTRPLHFYGNRVRKNYSVGGSNRQLRVSRPLPATLVPRRW